MLTFVNESKQTVKLQWMNQVHLPVEIGNLVPGEKWGQKTYNTHTWVITDEEGTLWNWVRWTRALRCNG